MIILLVLVLAANYTMLGFTEALVWSKKGDDAFTWNEHIPLAIQRILLGVLVLGCGWQGFEVSCYALLSSLPMFFFFHDGTIYLVRNDINDALYDKRWFDESTTSSATFKTMSARWRIILFSVGVCLTIYFQFI